MIAQSGNGTGKSYSVVVAVILKINCTRVHLALLCHHPPTNGFGSLSSLCQLCFVTENVVNSFDSNICCVLLSIYDIRAGGRIDRNQKVPPGLSYFRRV